MTILTASFPPALRATSPDADQRRITAAFRATVGIGVALLALVCALSFAHGKTAPPATGPVAEEFGWPI